MIDPFSPLSERLTVGGISGTLPSMAIPELHVAA